MAVTTKWYGEGLSSFLAGDIDWDADTIKVAMATASYTPSQNVHDYFDDITNEVSGTAYTAGGVTLASKTNTQASGVVTLDAADAVWSTSTIASARYGIIYKSTGTASTSPLVAYVDFDGDVSSTAADFTITWNASGILTVTAS